jgi:murein L,D-transpeptidase YafK
MRRVHCALLIAVILAAPALAVDSPPGEDVTRCPRRGPHVLVVTKDHELLLCERGREVASYRVALGRAGTGKRAQGDDKTPLGSYTLGAPRPSPRFGTFIPIAYPTREQRLRGFTGTAVGIHGPARRFRWAGRLNAWADWTAGCVALATDDEVEAIAAWVQKLKPAITIR